MALILRQGKVPSGRAAALKKAAGTDPAAKPLDVKLPVRELPVTHNHQALLPSGELVNISLTHHSRPISLRHHGSRTRSNSADAVRNGVTAASIRLQSYNNI
jgi:hypothetical protein